jgi:hypothetical protein
MELFHTEYWTLYLASLVPKTFWILGPSCFGLLDIIEGKNGKCVVETDRRRLQTEVPLTHDFARNKEPVLNMTSQQSFKNGAVYKIY